MADQIPEHVFVDAWRAAATARTGEPIDLPEDEIERIAAVWMGPAHRAIVESAYRAGQAAVPGIRYGWVEPAGSEVEEQWGYRLTYLDGSTKTRQASSRDVAEAVAASPANWQEPGPSGELLHRRVITTPWEAVSVALTADERNDHG